jgi:hypothetical protein
MENTERCLRDALYAVLAQGVAAGISTSRLLHCLADVTTMCLHTFVIENCPTGGDVEELLTTYDATLRHGTLARMRALEAEEEPA